MAFSRKLSYFLYVDFMILMVTLGCSDALRGVFAPVFAGHFSLKPADLSLIITVSYIGNLVFMLTGTRFSDSFGLRLVFILSILLWIFALVVYLCTDNFTALLVGMFFAMGASTLINIMMNLMSPLVFLVPGVAINTLFFTQGIGTTLTQSVISANVESFSHWKMVNTALLVAGLAALIAFIMLSKKIKGLEMVRDKSSSPKIHYQEILNKPAFLLLVICFGGYFIAEHGLLNWLNIYLISAKGFSVSKAAIFPSLFFGAIALGRLLLSPLVEKLGIIKSLKFSFVGGSICYVTAFLLGGEAYYIFALSGFLLSLIYPTLTLSIRLYFPKYNVATATGVIMSAATIFDISFNLVFGSVIESLGYNHAMLLLPLFMVISCLIFVFLTKLKKVYIGDSASI